MSAPARSATRTWWLAAILGSLSCANTLTWSVSAPDLEPASGEASTIEHLWFVTEGTCSPLPGPTMDHGEVLGARVSAPLGQGTYCFWAMQVRRFTREGANAVGTPACRLESIASETRSLPAQQGLLALQEARIETDAQRAVWDAAVERLADCAPRRDPARCDCPFSPSSEDDPSGCAAAIDGDLLAMSDTHTCVGRMGAQSVTCWGEERGFGAGRGRVGPTELAAVAQTNGLANSIVELDTGPGITCARTEPGFVHCVGALADEIAAAGWQVSPLADSASPDPAHRVVASQVAIGNGFVCTVGRPFSPSDSTLTSSIQCVGYGGPTPDVISSWNVRIPGGGRPLAFAVGGRHACVAHSTPTSVSVSCTGDNAFGQSCPVGCAREIDWSVSRPVALALSPQQLALAPTRSCAVGIGAILYCWGEGFPNGGAPVQLATNVSSVRLDDALVCVSFLDGTVRCGTWAECTGSAELSSCTRWTISWVSANMPPMQYGDSPDLAAPVSLPAIGGDGICGITGRDGTVLCASIASDRDAVGRTATTTDERRVPGRSAVCPYPFALP